MIRKAIYSLRKAAIGSTPHGPPRRDLASRYR
jgi:hypothetical protein